MHLFSAIDNKDATLKTVINVLGMLPKVNVQIIKFLTDILRKIVQHSSINKMTAMNFAIVFAPSLLRPPPAEDQTKKEEGEAAIIEQMKDAPYTTKLMELFITHSDEIFKDVCVPSMALSLT